MAGFLARPPYTLQPQLLRPHLPRSMAATSRASSVTMPPARACGAPLTRSRLRHHLPSRSPLHSQSTATPAPYGAVARCIIRTAMDNNVIYCGDNLEVMPRYISDESVHLIYIDPPFNTSRQRSRSRTFWTTRGWRCKWRLTTRVYRDKRNLVIRGRSQPRLSGAPALHPCACGYDDST